MEFGENFKAYRKNNGFTQSELASILDISQSNISDWENNVSRPEYENLIKLAALYQISVDELLGVSNN